MFRENDIINCFTMEASFLGYFNQRRETKQFLPETYEKMGMILGRGIYEFVMINEDNDKFKE